MTPDVPAWQAEASIGRQAWSRHRPAREPAGEPLSASAGGHPLTEVGRRHEQFVEALWARSRVAEDDAGASPATPRPVVQGRPVQRQVVAGRGTGSPAPPSDRTGMGERAEPEPAADAPGAAGAALAGATGPTAPEGEPSTPGATGSTGSSAPSNRLHEAPSARVQRSDAGSLTLGAVMFAGSRALPSAQPATASWPTSKPVSSTNRDSGGVVNAAAMPSAPSAALSKPQPPAAAVIARHAALPPAARPFLELGTSAKGPTASATLVRPATRSVPSMVWRPVARAAADAMQAPVDALPMGRAAAPVWAAGILAPETDAPGISRTREEGATGGSAAAPSGLAEAATPGSSSRTVWRSASAAEVLPVRRSPSMPADRAVRPASAVSVSGSAVATSINPQSEPVGGTVKDTRSPASTAVSTFTAPNAATVPVHGALIARAIEPTASAYPAYPSTPGQPGSAPSPAIAAPSFARRVGAAGSGDVEPAGERAGPGHGLNEHTVMLDGAPSNGRGATAEATRAVVEAASTAGVAPPSWPSDAADAQATRDTGASFAGPVRPAVSPVQAVVVAPAGANDLSRTPVARAPATLGGADSRSQTSTLASGREGAGHADREPARHPLEGYTQARPTPREATDHPATPAHAGVTRRPDAPAHDALVGAATVWPGAPAYPATPVLPDGLTKPAGPGAIFRARTASHTAAAVVPVTAAGHGRPVAARSPAPGTFSAPVIARSLGDSTAPLPPKSDAASDPRVEAPFVVGLPAATGGWDAPHGLTVTAMSVPTQTDTGGPLPAPSGSPSPMPASVSALQHHAIAAPSTAPGSMQARTDQRPAVGSAGAAAAPVATRLSRALGRAEPSEPMTTAAAPGWPPLPVLEAARRPGLPASVPITAHLHRQSAAAHAPGAATPVARQASPIDPASPAPLPDAVAALQPPTISTPVAAAAPAPDLEALVEQACARIFENLALAQERRGVTPWL